MPAYNKFNLPTILSLRSFDSMEPSISDTIPMSEICLRSSNGLHSCDKLHCPKISNQAKHLPNCPASKFMWREQWRHKQRRDILRWIKKHVLLTQQKILRTISTNYFPIRKLLTESCGCSHGSWLPHKVADWLYGAVRVLFTNVPDTPPQPPIRFSDD